MIAELIGKKASYQSSFESAAQFVRKNAKKGDLVLVMGAGDVFHVFDFISFDEEK